MNELFSLMGYDAMYFGRMTDAERLKRITDNNLIFNW